MFYKYIFVSPKYQTVRGRGGFRISSKGWQRYLHGVAKISKGVAKKMCATPFLSSFFLLSYTTLRIYAHFFDILDTNEEIYKIYLFLLFLDRLLPLYASLVPRDILVQEGLNPLKWSGGGEGGRATPLKTAYAVGRLYFSK